MRRVVRAAVRRITENPKRSAPSPHGSRPALLRRFPYLSIFRETDEAAYVVAAFHTSRDPRTWQQRTA